MKKPRKEALLKGYSSADPTPYIVFTARLNPSKQDCCTDTGGDTDSDPRLDDEGYDEDGDRIYAQALFELMNGPYEMLVFLRPTVTKEMTLRALTKIAAWIQKDAPIERLRQELEEAEPQAFDKTMILEKVEYLRKQGYSDEEIESVFLKEVKSVLEDDSPIHHSDIKF